MTRYEAHEMTNLWKATSSHETQGEPQDYWRAIKFTGTTRPTECHEIHRSHENNGEL